MNYSSYNPYPQYGMYYQMGQQQSQQTQQQINNFVWVQGEAGAKAYPVAAGNTVLLMDSDSAVLYVKSADASGRPLPMETYDLVKRQPYQPPQVDMSQYVKLSDLENEVSKLVNKMLGGEAK